MATTKQDIARWFQSGKDKGATHMVVVCDTFDWSDYPAYVSESEDVQAIAEEHHKSGKVMEVYDLRMDMEMQLSERRAFHGVNRQAFR